MTKNTKTVVILLVIAALIAIVPLFALKGAEFGGSDDAGSEIHLHLVPGLDLLRRLGTLHDGQTDVDGIAVEDAGKGGGNDALHAARLDG